MGTMPYVAIHGHGNQPMYGDASSSGGEAVSIQRNVFLVGDSQATREGLTTTNTQVRNGSGHGISVSGIYTVVLENLFVVGTQNAIDCSGATIFVQGCMLTQSTTGLNAQGCQVIADGNWATLNTHSGVSIYDGKYTLTNNLITGNGTSSNSDNSATGVLLNNSMAGSIFAFNTVYDNDAGSTVPGGIVCSSPALIQDSIVFNNHALNGSQFTANCALSNVVTGTDAAPNAIMLAPVFDSNVNLDISNIPNETQNKACCIDKLAAPGTPNADHDYNFTQRPKGTGVTPYDIGATEAE